MNAILIIGIGNEYGHDDAVGILVARALKRMIPDGVTVLEQSGEAMALIGAWADAEQVALIDAVFSGVPPGALHHFEVGRDPLPADLSTASTHTWGVAQAVELARLLGCLPHRITLYGIEGVDFSPGVGLSPMVARSIPTVVRQIQQELCPRFALALGKRFRPLTHSFSSPRPRRGASRRRGLRRRTR
jgi:hydrogenase maturation protease